MNEAIGFVKENSDVEFDDLYVTVDGFNDGFAFRSAIDILRGTCTYCRRSGTMTCVDCMWWRTENNHNGNDRWLF